MISARGIPTSLARVAIRSVLCDSRRYAPRVRRALSLGVLVLAACGSRADGRGADELPTIDTVDRIPGIPAPVRPVGTATEPFQELWTAAQIALEISLAPPAVDDESVYGEWIEDRLAPFLRDRADAIRRVKSRLRGLGEAPADEQVMGAAALGHLLEDTARQVLETDVPVDPRRPARAAAIREALEGDVGPLYASALEAYVTCLRVDGASATHLASFRAHCEARAAALRERDAE